LNADETRHPRPRKLRLHVRQDFRCGRKLSQIKGFDHYGLFVQDYGGPVGFRILARHPEALDWLVIQNTNAYEVGFTAAWDGFRGALWKNRSPETEKPLAAFLTHDAIKGIYLHGAKSPELMSPDNWESDYGFMQCFGCGSTGPLRNEKTLGIESVSSPCAQRPGTRQQFAVAVRLADVPPVLVAAQSHVVFPLAASWLLSLRPAAVLSQLPLVNT
jgi:pimeloyl-ACP methyl ester carboxylesterase